MVTGTVPHQAHPCSWQNPDTLSKFLPMHTADSSPERRAVHFHKVAAQLGTFHYPKSNPPTQVKNATS